MIIKAAIGQTCPVTGDIKGNTKQIIDNIERAIREGVDVIVFPETAITGYCCGALFNRGHFIADAEAALYDIIDYVTGEIVVVLGVVDFLGIQKNGKLNLGNSAVVMQHGIILNTYQKTYLANDDHHEDRKYFSPGNPDKLVTTVLIKGESVRIATPICEDIWSDDHEECLIGRSKEVYGADLICVPNYSYFYYGKHTKRETLVSKLSKRNYIPIIYANCAAVGDIVKNVMIYDGGSMAYDVEGNKIAQAKFFETDYIDFNVDLNNEQEGYCVNHALDYFPNKFDEIFDALVFAQKEFFRVCGLNKAQIHLSGGIDSAVVAVIAVQAMGKENVVFITNPTSDNSEETISVAQYIADKLGVPLHTNTAGQITDLVIETAEASFNKEASSLAKACSQAVGRTVQGLVASHMFGTGIIACGNHTEIVEGWANFHDIGSIGVHSLIGDLTKVEVFQISKWINEYFDDIIIPEKLYNGEMKPQAELADFKFDPFDYFIRSGIDAEMIRNGRGPHEIIASWLSHSLTPDFFPLDWDNKSVYDKVTIDEFAEQVWSAFKNSKRSVYKAAQSAPQVIISPTSRGFSNRETIINHYAG